MKKTVKPVKNSENQLKPVKVSKPVSAGLSVPVLDISGKESGVLSLPKDVFTTQISKEMLAQYMHAYLTNQRQGTVSAKTRSDVIGSTRKIYRQKGTGRARHGAKSAPIFVGGGVTFGPKPREFQMALNKKQRRKVLFGALTLSLKAKHVAGLSDKALTIEPKTKVIAQFLKSAQLTKSPVLVVMPKIESNAFVKAARNIKNISLIDARSLNAYEIVKAEKLLFVESALPVFVEHFVKQS